MDQGEVPPQPTDGPPSTEAAPGGDEPVPPTEKPTAAAPAPDGDEAVLPTQAPPAEPTSVAPAPIVPWSGLPTQSDVPAAAAPPTLARRILEAVAWIVGIAAVLFFGRIYALLSGGGQLTAEEQGEVVGSVIGAVIVGVFVRWIVVRIRHRGRVLSPWILVVAVLVLLINLGRGAGLGGIAPAPSPATTNPSAPPGRPIDTYAVVDPPFTIEPASSDEVTEFKASFGDLGKRMEVRRITRDGSIDGYLVIVDAGSRFPASGITLFEAGIKREDGVATERARLAGHDVVVANIPAEGVAFVGWLESPHVLIVYGLNTDSAKDMAEAVIAAYD